MMCNDSNHRPFPASIDEQVQYPDRHWELDTIEHDAVALAILDVLDHWRRNQDSDAAIELLTFAIEEVRVYQGHPPRGRPVGSAPTP